MCKRTLSVGVLVCSMTIGQAFCMDANLLNLTNALYVLAAALQPVGVVPPTLNPAPVVVQPPLAQPVPLPPVPPVPPITVVPVPSVVQPNVVNPIPQPPLVNIPPAPGPFVPTPATTPPVPPVPPVVRPVNVPAPRPAVNPVMPLKPVQQPQSNLGDITNAPQTALDEGDIKSKLRNLLGVVDNSGKSAIKLGKQKQVVITPKNYQLEINMAGNLPPYMDQLKSMPVVTAQQKADKKAFARAILNALLSWVNKKQVNKETVSTAVNVLLQVDPLLISTAALVLEKVGYNQEQIRALMVELFRKQVTYIEQRFIDEHASANITAGARDDIDEAVSYPMELLGATRLADNIKLMSERKTDAQYVNADSFLRAIDQEKQRLCAAIQRNESKFGFFPEYYAVYSLYCGKVSKNKVDVYCTTPNCTYGPGIKDVTTTIVNLSTAIKDLLGKIERYKTTQVGSEKVMIMQDILGTLSDFNYFFSNPHFCTICLKNALDQVKSTDPRFGNALAQIANFIKSVADLQNNRYLDNFVMQSMPAIQNVINNVAQMSNNDAWLGYQRAKAHWAQFHTK